MRFFNPHRAIVKIGIDRLFEHSERILHALCLNLSARRIVMTAAAKLFKYKLYVYIARTAGGYMNHPADCDKGEGRAHSLDREELVRHLRRGDAVGAFALALA